MKAMKEFFCKNHQTIDILAVVCFLYSLFVCIFLYFFSWVNNEKIYIMLVLVLPCVLINKKLINRTNKFLHSVFGFRR